MIKFTSEEKSREGKNMEKAFLKITSVAFATEKKVLRMKNTLLPILKQQDGNSRLKEAEKYLIMNFISVRFNEKGKTDFFSFCYNADLHDSLLSREIRGNTETKVVKFLHAITDFSKRCNGMDGFLSQSLVADLFPY